MAKSNNAFLKKQRAESKRKKRVEKQEKKADRKKEPKSGSLEDMIVYVDENGNFSDTPPPPPAPKKKS